jgi:hypothetical protein
MKMKYKKENRNKIIAVAILGIIGISVGAFVLSPLAPLYEDRFGPYTESRYILPPRPPPLPTPPADPIVPYDETVPPVAPVLSDIIPSVNTDGNIIIKWSAVAGASSYNVYASDGGEFIVIKNTGSKSMSDIRGDGEYYYYVTAISTYGESIRSNIEIVEVNIYVPPVTPPVTPPDTEDPATPATGLALSNDAIFGIVTAIFVIAGGIVVVFVVRRRKR